MLCGIAIHPRARGKGKKGVEVDSKTATNITISSSGVLANVRVSWVLQYLAPKKYNLTAPPKKNGLVFSFSAREGKLGS